MNARLIAPILLTYTALIASALHAQPTEVVLHSFSESGPKGIFPNGNLISDGKGNLYGTTASGGIVGPDETGGEGLVYKIDSTGAETVLYSFTGGADGGRPNPGLVLDAAGNLYGTTYYGGSSQVAFNGAGVVFKLSAAGAYSVLYSFTGGTDGEYPASGVTLGADGNLYGTTEYGGNLVGCYPYPFNPNKGCGVVFQVNPTGQETVLYTFLGGVDGAYPINALVSDQAGNLYGTTSGGGNFYYCPEYDYSHGGCGVLFSVNRQGHETVLVTFTTLPGSGYPSSGLVIDAIGNVYGTTGSGVIYELSETDQYTVIYQASLGLQGVIRDAQGNFYGTTFSNDPVNPGIVYKVDAVGAYTLLYSFTMGTDGFDPMPGLLRDAAGNLYGTTGYGGTGGAGVVYKLDEAGAETALHNFTPTPGGGVPQGPVLRDAQGNLYGTTTQSVANPPGISGGVLYELNAKGLSVLHSFTGGADGDYPEGHLARDVAGNLYGTTLAGGASGRGVLYEVSASGEEAILHTFTGGADGGSPVAGVILDASGNLYGTATSGGSGLSGVVFKLTTSGTFSVLHNFTGEDGASPNGLVLDAAGNLYGTAQDGGAANYGSVFEISTAGAFTVLYAFPGGSPGANPVDGVALDAGGNLYGVTSEGGADFYGVVYKLDSSGVESVLHPFTGRSDGGTPAGGVIRDRAGNLYGTTSQGGGSCSCGVAYRVNLSGTESVLYTFQGGTDGGDPLTALTFGAAGDLYGTASTDGVGGSGVLFEIKGVGAVQ